MGNNEERNEGILMLKWIRLWLHRRKLDYYDFRAPLCFHDCQTGNRSTLINWELFDAKGRPVFGRCPHCDIRVKYDPALKTLKDFLEGDRY